MTIREALEITIGMLEKVPVPVAQTETVAIPISQAVDNLRACIRGLDQAAEEGETDGRDGEAE